MKNGSSTEVREVVDGFVSQLSDIIRRQSLEKVTRALGESFDGHTNGNGRARVRRHSAPGQKRSPEVLAATIKDVGEYVAAHPGQGVEQIKVALHKTTSELMLPIQKLLSQRLISRKGQKRATKYFPAKT